MVVDAEGLWYARAVDLARVDRDRAPAAEQAPVAGVGIEGEGDSGLGDGVDQLLERPGDPGVPHRHRQHPELCRAQPLSRRQRLIPLVLTLCLHLAPRDYVHLRERRLGAERWRRILEEIEPIRDKGRLLVEHRLDQLLGDPQRLRSLAPGRGVDQQEV